MKAKNTKRTSFDLSEENSKNLGIFSEKMGCSYSKAVNYMLKVLLSLKPDVKEELAGFCDCKTKEIQKNMELMSVFELQEARQKMYQYQELSLFFWEGEKPISKMETGMKKIYLKEGYVLIPDKEDWIILDNYRKPSECMYAGVVETREPLDGKTVYQAKHFVYFTDYKYGKEYPADLKDAIFTACCKKDASFKSVLNAVVTPIYDGEKIPSNMINLEEYKAAPCPGLFHIVERGDSQYWNDSNPDYEPPFGVMIIR